MLGCAVCLAHSPSSRRLGPCMFHRLCAVHCHMCYPLLMLCAVSPNVHHPQPLKELPPADEPFKDKFLVQSCQTDAADTDDAKIIFENTDKNSIIDQKLLCTFNTPDGEMPQPGPSDTLVSPLGWVGGGASAPVWCGIQWESEFPRAREPACGRSPHKPPASLLWMCWCVWRTGELRRSQEH